MNGPFSKEDAPVANKHVWRCSTSFVIREIQATTTAPRVTPTATAEIKETDSEKQFLAKAEENCSPHTLLLECKSLPPLWRTVWSFLKMLEFSGNSAIPPLATYSGRINTYLYNT